MKPRLIYLDVCVLSRPFDDQNYLRIKLETEALNLILSKVKGGKYGLLVSPVHIKEIDAIPDIYERIELQTVLDRFGVRIAVNAAEARKRAGELIDSGFGVADAAHVAFAEKAGLVASNGEARRQIKAGGLRVNDRAVVDDKAVLTASDLSPQGVIKLSLGKKKHVLLRAI